MMTETTEAKAPDPSVGATTDIPLTWHQINWRQAERTVRRLQTRIAQATQADKWGKAKALQRWLTHSLTGFGQPDQPQTLSKRASLRSVEMIAPNGSSKGTFAPVSIMHLDAPLKNASSGIDQQAGL